MIGAYSFIQTQLLPEEQPTMVIDGKLPPLKRTYDPEKELLKIVRKIQKDRKNVGGK